MGNADHSITSIVARRMPRNEAWVDEAPCRGQWWVTDLPPDVMRHTARRIVVERMRVALTMCAACPFTQECYDRVSPRESFYDGVCAGFVFRNGEVIGGMLTTSERAS